VATNRTVAGSRNGATNAAFTMVGDATADAAAIEDPEAAGV
jgi:hypothetical protein